MGRLWQKFIFEKMVACISQMMAFLIAGAFVSGTLDSKVIYSYFYKIKVFVIFNFLFPVL